MRVLFLALILANVAFFFWQYTLAPDKRVAPQPIAPAQDDAPPLVLLKDGGEPAVRHRRAGASVAEHSAAAVKETPKPAAAASSPPAATPAATPSPKPPAGNEMACFIAGPFARRDAARAAVDAFRAKGLEAGLEQRETRTDRYWLHTPVLPDRKAALSLMKDIEAKGIRDMALVRAGDFKNSISLGFYHNESSARRRLARLKAKDIDVALEAEHGTQQTYWTRYKTARDNSAADAAWKTISASNPKIQREGLPCR